MTDQAASPSTDRLLSAAQYLRMSTEHQQYSIANQSAAIALYAAAHKIGIIRSFVDEGKTGRSIKNRRGLQTLIETVTSGDADFDLILVYDVSRWGRFPDADEAAHYEFLCKKAGVQVRYCAEQFENDNSTTSNLLKALKRTMAGEYSRELSVKIVDGQRRLAAMGYWQGGYPPYGLRRRIIDRNGKLKQTLELGECKSISTDRVLLTPGPKNEVETVQLIFDLFTKQRKTRYEIASVLNQRGEFWGIRPWNIQKIHHILKNPIYKGTYPYGKRHLYRTLPRDKWLVREHAFPALVSSAQWDQTQGRLKEEIKPKPVDSEMLEDLRRLWKREGTLNSTLIQAAKDVPSVTAYRKHFGGLAEAYKLIGFPSKRDVPFPHYVTVTRNIRNAICQDICAKVRGVGATAEQTRSSEILLNGNTTVKISLARERKFWTAGTRWELKLGKRFTSDIHVIARLGPSSRDVMDYFVFPRISRLHGGLHAKREGNAPFLNAYRFADLEPLITSFCRLPLPEER